MPLRKIVFANEETYHIVNRGVDSKLIFTTTREYKRAKQTLDFYRYQSDLKLSLFLSRDEKEKEKFLKKRQNSQQMVDIIAYCFMPSHIHLLLKQIANNGVSKFMSKFTNSFARYFNSRHKRKGPLFEGMFRAIRIETEEQLIHVSRYIHINPVVSYVIKRKDLTTYHWSSLREYLGKENLKICNSKLILDHFSSRDAYYKFLKDQVDYGRKLQKIKRLILEH
jgi:putative transposase